MKIALTGTPGTGKSSVAETLGDQGYKILDLTDFVKENNLGTQENEFEVDVPAMVEEFKEEFGSSDVVVDGHLSHHLPADYCIVLRCEPDELRNRLEERDYDTEKIEENIESEVLDVILTEAVARQEKIIEIDTTGREPEKVSSEIIKKIRRDDTGYGDIDWSGFI